MSLGLKYAENVWICYNNVMWNQCFPCSAFPDVDEFIVFTKFVLSNWLLVSDRIITIPQTFVVQFEISVQHVEIYLDKLRDLLSKNEDAKLEIKTTSSNNKQKVWVKNLSSHKVENFGKVSDVTTAF